MDKNESNVAELPLAAFFREGWSQTDRILQEVMQSLFMELPDKRQNDPTPVFTLADGTKCFLKKFAAPYENQDGDLVYGFDIKLDSGPLSHLEFVVKCSGWERSPLSPD